MIKKIKPLISNNFNEGRLWDNWMIVHLCTGIVFGIFFELTEIGFFPSFFITLFLLIGWELTEAYYKIVETEENRMVDVFLGIAGFALAFAIAVPIDPVFTISAGLIILLIAVMMSWRGWKERNKHSKGI